MAVEDAKKFIEKLRSDPELGKKLETASDEERVKIVSQEGYDFTPEEFKTAALEMSPELSDEDLDAVAGGGAATWVGVGVGATATTGSGIAAAAATAAA
jgi:predicted ribosomally synthesized peptide with nif11-like leader